MKALIPLALLAALVLPPRTAEAQRDDSFVFGVSAGATIPSGTAAEQHRTGPNGSLFWGIGGVDSPLGVRFEGFYTLLGDSDDTGPVRDQGKARTFALMANAVFNVYGNNRRLYATGGFGGYWYNPDGQGTNTTNDLALNGGLGIWFPGINTFVEARWMNLYRALPDSETGARGRKSARLFPVTLGIMF